MEEVLGTETLNKLIEQGGLWPSSDAAEFKMTVIEGIPFSTSMVESVNAVKTFEARSDDVFIDSYPKAGTTWTQTIVSAICHKGDLEKVNQSHVLFRVPFMEENTFVSTKDVKIPSKMKLMSRMKSPRTIKSHLPGHLLPPDIMKKKARIVYVARNPKDVAVSYYYFHLMFPASFTHYDTWEDFFNDFCSGNVYSGAWWEHYLYFWNKRHEANILFLKFEDMKRDLKGVVQKTANFLGYEFTEDIIDGIVEHCSFENMKQNPQTNPDTVIKLVMKGHGKDTPDDEPAMSFMRKGKVGGWKNLFTVAQNEKMDALIMEKLEGTGLTFEY
ncbi:sulfotransferase 1A3-like [Amphiura filiformis]|uniref:sulfotransferase 1A3-like n=1 Tax=Amphiura filiformis TaxID=82378 RepID=UPI003B22864F